MLGMLHLGGVCRSLKGQEQGVVVFLLGTYY